MLYGKKKRIDQSNPPAGGALRDVPKQLALDKKIWYCLFSFLRKVAVMKGRTSFSIGRLLCGFTGGFVGFSLISKGRVFLGITVAILCIIVGVAISYLEVKMDRGSNGE